MIKLVATVAITIATQLVPSIANAQSSPNYPNRPIKIVVGYPPGGSGDTRRSWSSNIKRIRSRLSPR